MEEDFTKVNIQPNYEDSRNLWRRGTQKKRQKFSQNLAPERMDPPPNFEVNVTIVEVFEREMDVKKPYVLDVKKMNVKIWIYMWKHRGVVNRPLELKWLIEVHDFQR